MPNPTPGTLLGAYRVEGQLGAGSMGEVFRGIDTGLNRRVAIKILSEQHRDSAELRQRFVREGRAVAAISHPNVVQVFATGTFDNRPYIAMELLEGTDLGSAVEQTGPLPSAAAAQVVRDAAQGLFAASKAGLIHRDVKPSNLVRLVSGEVKVTDFGLAKPVDPGSEPALTAMGVVVGTPDYIAPEQARGDQIDERVDIYALGGTLYFLLTGTPPFRTGKPNEDKYLKVVARHLRNPAPDAAETNPSVDRELASLCKRMMAKPPEERPGYPELIAQLTNVLARLDPSSVPELLAGARERSRPLRVPSEPGAAPQGGAPLAGDRARARPGLPAWLTVFTVLSVGLFVAGLVVYLTTDAAPARRSSALPPAGSGAPQPAPPDASPSPVVPAGMVVVTRPDGSRFLVDASPVSAAAFATLFTQHRQPGSPSDPVIDVKYDEARSYAASRSRRLLRSDEWDRATTWPGVIVPRPDLFEWVEPVDGKLYTVRAHGKTEVRRDQEYKDVTFRLARDI